MGYQDDMKNVSWQKKRLKILERDNWSCKSDCCKKRSQKLEVHHVDYIPDLKIWEYPDDMLLTLCSDCHTKENERTGAEKYLLNSMKMKGFLISDVLSLSCKFDTNEQFTQSLLKILRTNG